MNNYDHYIAVDWALHNMAVAHMTSQNQKIKVVDVASDIKELKAFLMSLRGSKALCFEETTPSHWLFVELKDLVDEIVVCDPYRNHLLSEGAKTDKIDARKLVQLFAAGLLKPVFHSLDPLMYLRKLVHAYQCVVQAGVRLKNQRSALLRGLGLDRDESVPSDRIESFIDEGLQCGIKNYEIEKKRYEAEFRKLRIKMNQIKLLQTIPGIGLIGAIKILAIVVDPRRFPHSGHWLSYCGLVKHDRISGGRSYGKKTPRHNRTLKSVFKTAALSCLDPRIGLYDKVLGDNTGVLKRYYNSLIDKNKAPFNARNATARRIAVLALGVLKSNQPFDDRWRSYELAQPAL